MRGWRDERVEGWEVGGMGGVRCKDRVEQRFENAAT